MRNVVFAINVTADGYCDHTLFNPDAEVLDYFTTLMRDTAVLAYGRRTYELMIPYWPEAAKDPHQTKADSNFARAFISVPKVVVFSKTIRTSTEPRTSIFEGQLQDKILRLKHGEGGTILTGGVTLPSELLRLGLLDEIHIVVHPFLAGNGRRLFDSPNFKERFQLQLTSTRIFESGCVALHYLISH